MPAQSPLFDDLPRPTAAPTLQALTSALVKAAPSLGLEQKRFNQWLAKISEYQAELDALERLEQAYRQQMARKIQPLLQLRDVMSKAMAQYLDLRLQSPGLSKGQRQFMAELICDLVLNLLDSAASPAEQSELQALYNRHSPVDLATQAAASKAQEEAELRAMASEVFGIDLAAQAPADSPQEALEALRRQMRAALAAEQIRRDAENAHQTQRKASRKAGPKHAAKMKAQQAAADTLDASKTLREVYRKLASALHPDRAIDEADRLRKTALMVQVNAANDKKDLLALLQLQMQAEQIDPLAIAEMAQDKLRRFNLVLAEQAESLLAEVKLLQMRLRAELQLSFGKAPSPAALEACLRERAQMLEQELLWRRQTLQEVQDDRALKAWLKQQKALLRDPFD